MTLSRISTVLSAFEKAVDRIREVIILESRPAFEGRNMAKSVAEMGIKVKIITDLAFGNFLPAVDQVVVGADAILSCGDIVHKIGTKPLALLSQKEDIPFFVVSSLFKADIYHTGVKFKKRESSEIWESPPTESVSREYLL